MKRPMMSTLAFAAGFAAGWITRGSMASSRSAVVELLAFALDTMERARRALAIEIERLEDIAAEAHDAVARRRAERAAEQGDGASVGHAA
jgi:hypothetical protein